MTVSSLYVYLIFLGSFGSRTRVCDRQSGRWRGRTTRHSLDDGQVEADDGWQDGHPRFPHEASSL